MLFDLLKMDAEELIVEVLGLNDLERCIFFDLCSSKKEKTVKQLVEVTGRTRSVVQRALQSLLEKNLVVREGRIDKTVYYVYAAVPLKEVKGVVKKILNEWTAQVDKILG